MSDTHRVGDTWTEVVDCDCCKEDYTVYVVVPYAECMDCTPDDTPSEITVNFTYNDEVKSITGQLTRGGDPDCPVDVPVNCTTDETTIYTAHIKKGKELFFDSDHPYNISGHIGQCDFVNSNPYPGCSSSSAVILVDLSLSCKKTTCVEIRYDGLYNCPNIFFDSSDLSNITLAYRSECNPITQAVPLEWRDTEYYGEVSDCCDITFDTTGIDGDYKIRYDGMNTSCHIYNLSKKLRFIVDDYQIIGPGAQEIGRAVCTILGKKLNLDIQQFDGYITLDQVLWVWTDEIDWYLGRDYCPDNNYIIDAVIKLYAVGASDTDTPVEEVDIEFYKTDPTTFVASGSWRLRYFVGWTVCCYIDGSSNLCPYPDNAAEPVQNLTLNNVTLALEIDNDSSKRKELNFASVSLVNTDSSNCQTIVAKIDDIHSLYCNWGAVQFDHTNTPYNVGSSDVHANANDHTIDITLVATCDSERQVIIHVEDQANSCSQDIVAYPGQDITLMRPTDCMLTTVTDPVTGGQHYTFYGFYGCQGNCDSDGWYTEMPSEGEHTIEVRRQFYIVLYYEDNDGMVHAYDVGWFAVGDSIPDNFLHEPDLSGIDDPCLEFKTYDRGLPFTMPAYNIQVKAVLGPKQVTVMFDAVEGVGQFSNGLPYKYITGDCGDNLQLPETPQPVTDEVGSFKRWSPSINSTRGKFPAQDTTYTAVYGTPNIDFGPTTVLFDAGEFGIFEDDGTRYKELTGEQGSDMEVPDPPVWIGGGSAEFIRWEPSPEETEFKFPGVFTTYVAQYE